MKIGVLLAAAVFIFAGCEITTGTGTGTDTGATKARAIPLIKNEWVEASNSSAGGERWFKFTAATAETCYIHISFGSSADLDVEVFESGGNQVGSSENFSGGGGTSYFKCSTVSGRTYYIKVTRNDSGPGTYRIGLNTMELPPGAFSTAAELTEDAWTEGAITATNREQWFKFTASAAGTYLHTKFLELNDLVVQVYDDKGQALNNGGTRLFSGPNGQSSLPVSSTAGQDWYVRITPYLSSGSGRYQIEFNTSATPR